MTQVHFTLKSEEIQSIIEYSVKDDVSKNILTTVFNQLMENQRTEYIQAKEYERTENRQPDPPAALKGRLDPKGTWQQNRDFRQSHLKMGTRIIVSRHHPAASIGRCLSCHRRRNHQRSAAE